MSWYQIYAEQWSKGITKLEYIEWLESKLDSASLFLSNIEMQEVIK